MKIRFFSSFCSSENCKSVYERLCETQFMTNYGKDKSIYITTEDDYTHVIIINTAMPEINQNIPKSHVIGLAFEPLQFLGLTQEFVSYAQKHIGKYYIGEKLDLPHPFVEHYGYMWHITPLLTVPSKKNIMSIMVSNKTSAPGHKYRHELVEFILRSNLPVDIYGRGCMYYGNDYANDSRLKGNFEDLEPYESYQYHICIENFKTPHYFSEKITNSLLCNTTPIYWGCENINVYFPDIVHILSGNIVADVDMLKMIFQNPEYYKKSIHVDSIKQKLNVLHNVEKIFAV
jgi:hypothetical protein